MSTDLWYSERWEEGRSAISLKITELLHREQSPYQRIEIFETASFGTLMTLDGLVMVTDRDNFIYHEMMSHTALFAHPDPRRVLIIGGGDCGTLREVLKHPGVEHVDMVELDERVTRVAERFFPELCAANADPRAHFHFQDGIQWVADAGPGAYDVVIIDSTDPVGPAAGLFSADFYAHCMRALGERGVVIGQSESPLFHAELIRSVRHNLRAAGAEHVASVQFPQCTYPSGWWSATLGGKGVDVTRFRVADAHNKPFPTRYYHAALHQGALALPAFLNDGD